MAAPPPGHVPFGSSLSAPLACCPLRRLNGSSPELAIPSNPSSRPPRGWQSQRPLAVRLPVPCGAEATSSRELRTPKLPSTHVPVGSRWQNTGSSLINTRATSCRTPTTVIPEPTPRRGLCQRLTIGCHGMQRSRGKSQTWSKRRRHIISRGQGTAPRRRKCVAE